MTAASNDAQDAGPESTRGGSIAGSAVLAADQVAVTFPSRRGQRPAKAVDDVNLSIGSGEILALIGESGCGKSTLARVLVGLIKPTAGRVNYHGAPLGYRGAELKAYRRHVQLVLQDPAAALNPRQNVFDAVAEGLRLHGLRDGLTSRVHRAMEQAGLRPVENYLARYPHELSGGQQQRVVIAGALALDPSVIIADEPVSSLDASVRGEILKLILDLRNQLDLSAVVVSHDLGLAWNIADRVAVMYLGRIVEIGTVEEVLLAPKHPYTRSLIAAVRSAAQAPHPLLVGEPPDPTRIPSGCRFHPRCPLRAESGDRGSICVSTPLPVLAADSVDRQVACHLAEEE